MPNFIQYMRDIVNTIYPELVQKHSDIMGITPEGLNSKVDKVLGKGLSQNDYTDIEKNKLASIDMSTVEVLSNKGAPSGYVPLDSSGKINPQYLSSLSVLDLFFPADEASMLALAQANPGDIAFRQDNSNSYQLIALPSSTLANWKQLNIVGVSSINGNSGIVNIATDDIPEGVINKYYTDERVDDRVYSLIQAGGNITIVYDDVNGIMTISANDTSVSWSEVTDKPAIEAHIADSNNPHNVTKAQIGLSNVDNTADAAKNVLSASKLTTSRKINGVNFDGTSDVVIPAAIDFTKPFQNAPAFSKVSAASLSIPIGTSVKVGAAVITVAGAAYALSLNNAGVGGLDTGAKTAGTDYSIYALEAGGFIISASKINPTGYTTANSKRIGGFHYGVIPETFTAVNNITSDDAGKIAGINAYSFWDLKFRPVCDPSGMVYVFGRWYDIYLLNVDHHLYGTSAAGKTIAGGAVTNGRNYPKIPLFYGGNGTVTYGSFTWFEAAEIGKAYSKDLISYDEFVGIAYGVLEATSAGAADTGITQHLANFTSKFGLCMATGCQWIWSKDLGRGPGATYAWKANTEGRGSIYSDDQGPVSAIFGGSRVYTVESGSRSSFWDYYVWGTGWNLGCRYACNHLDLA